MQPPPPLPSPSAGDPAAPAAEERRRRRRRAVVATAVAAAALAGAVGYAVVGGGGDSGTTGSPSPPGVTVAAPARAQETIVMWRAITGTRASPSARYDVVALDATARRPRLLTPQLEGEAQPLLFDRPSWSPDGERIAFTVELDGDPAAPFRTDVYVIDADGARVRRLTKAGRALHPVWSPDGQTIAFAKRASSQAASPRDVLATTIWTIRSDGSAERELVPSAGVTADTPGAWSPDGRSLAFTRRTYLDPERSLRSSTAIHVVAADGSGVRELIAGGSDPAWAPDGRSLAYASDVDRNGELSYGDQTSFANELYVAEADGSEPQRLTRTRDLNERSPAWSPDGTRIAFTRGEQFENAEATSVFVVEADGGCPTEIGADARAWYANAVWRPGESRSRFTPTCG